MKRILVSMLLVMFVQIYSFAQGDLPNGQEFLINNNFDNGLSNWNLFVYTTLDATFDLDTTSQLEGKNSVHIRVNTLSTSTKRDYHIQFYQNIATPNGIRPGYKYYLQYKVKANKAIDDFTVKVHMAHDPWIALEPMYGDYIGRSLEANQAITILDSLEFTDTDDKVKVGFDLGLISEAGVDFWIDDIHLIEVEKEEVPQEDREEDLPDGTELLTNNYFNSRLDNWELYSLDTTRAEYELDTNSVITGKNSVHVIVHNPYKSLPSGRIQLNQHNIPGGIVEGQYYFLSFNLKANKDIEKCFWTIYNEPDYQNWYNWDWVKAKANEVTHFSYRFKADKTDNSVYFAIDFGALQNDNTEIWIDDVHLIAVQDPLVEKSWPRGAIELLNNSYFDDGLENWEINANEDDASITLSKNYILEGQNSLYAHVKNASGNDPEQIQVRQKNLLDSVKTGTKYYIQFIAKANKNVSGLRWAVSRQNTSNETLYSEEFSLTAGEIVYVIDTVMSFSSNEKVSWSIDMGALDQDDVHLWFDGIHFMEMVDAPEAVFPPETTWNPEPPVSLEKPGYLQSVLDPQKGVTYTCISDPTAFGIPSGSVALISSYPKVQVWNADMTLMTLAFAKYILNAKDYTVYKTFSHYLNERRWSHIDPNIIYFCSGTQFKKFNVETEQVTTLHTFEGYNNATIGPWEGNISADDQYVVITNESGNRAIGAALYDIEQDKVLATKSFPSDSDIDWVSVSPSGEYIVVMDRKARKTEVYDLEFNFLRYVGVGAEHGDFAFDSEGNEVWVQVIPISMTRLSDGKFTKLLESSSGHISGRNLNHPGWALVSLDINSGNYYTPQFEVKLDESGIIRHFGYSRSSCTTYDNYPMGSVSPDGKKVVFNSDWLYGTGSSGDAVAFVSEYMESPTSIDDSGLIDKMEFELSQNYPNPFNPTTTINFKLSTEGMTKLVVYNVLGQKVKVLLNENIRAGSYSVPFNGSGLSSGIYFYKLQSNSQVEVKKMLLLK